MPSEQLETAAVVLAYKSLAQVEQAFRHFKLSDLEVRPIYHYTETRVRAHLLLCLLAYWVQRSLQGGLGVAAEVHQGILSRGWHGLTRFPLLLLWLGTAFLAPVIAQVLAMAVSREREYLADAGSAMLTRHPDALASALKKIEMQFAPTRSMKRGTAHLCIADPLGRRTGFQEGFWADLLATHPPMANRISRLMRLPREDAGMPLEA